MIEELRREIDEIDKEIIKLLKKRMDAAEKIAEYKMKNNMPMQQPSREKEVISKIMQEAEQEGLSQDAAEKIYREIIKQTRQHENNKNRT